MANFNGMGNKDTKRNIVQSVEDTNRITLHLWYCLHK